MSDKNQFCKVFDVEEWGQVAVMRDYDDDDSPEVRFYHKTKLGNGVSMVAVQFDGDDAVRVWFDEIDQKNVKGVLDALTAQTIKPEWRGAK